MLPSLQAKATRKVRIWCLGLFCYCIHCVCLTASCGFYLVCVCVCVKSFPWVLKIFFPPNRSKASGALENADMGPKPARWESFLSSHKWSCKCHIRGSRVLTFISQSQAYRWMLSGYVVYVIFLHPGLCLPNVDLWLWRMINMLCTISRNVWCPDLLIPLVDFMLNLPQRRFGLHTRGSSKLPYGSSAARGCCPHVRNCV